MAPTSNQHFSPRPVQRLPQSRIPIWSPAGPVPVPSSCPLPAPKGSRFADRDEPQPSTSSASGRTSSSRLFDHPSAALPMIVEPTILLPDHADIINAPPTEGTVVPAVEEPETSTINPACDSPAGVPAAWGVASTSSDQAEHSNILNHASAPLKIPDPVVNDTISNLNFSSWNFNESSSQSTSRDIFPSLELSGEVESLSSDFCNIENFIRYIDMLLTCYFPIPAGPAYDLFIMFNNFKIDFDFNVVK